MSAPTVGYVSIAPLLKRLGSVEAAREVSAIEIAAAIELIFENKISPVQFAILLWALHSTGRDTDADVLAASAQCMRLAAAQIDRTSLAAAIRSRSLAQGNYHGGLCDIVGTGGDGHNTFNISTTASIVASALLLVAKHGNNSSTSLSGSADLLQHAPNPPVITAITATDLPKIYESSNYAFLYAREWHPSMKFAAAVRKELPVRTIMNLLGPLANPVHDSGLLEARVLGVAKKQVGPAYAEALRLSGASKAMVVCGDEDLDELSCAGVTHCWYIHGNDSSEHSAVHLTNFEVAPADFGLPTHSLDEVHGGKSAQENADILMQILRNERPDDDPVLQFVLLNTAALLTIAGICEADSSNMGSGDNGQVVTERGPGGLRWKEGLRRARWCIRSGAALKQWQVFVHTTNALASPDKP